MPLPKLAYAVFKHDFGAKSFASHDAARYLLRANWSATQIQSLVKLACSLRSNLQFVMAYYRQL